MINSNSFKKINWRQFMHRLPQYFNGHYLSNILQFHYICHLNHNNYNIHRNITFYIYYFSPENINFLNDY